jgi:lambda family phage portal protein
VSNRLPCSTIRPQADGSVERWDARVGRWVSAPGGGTANQASASDALPARAAAPAAVAVQRMQPATVGFQQPARRVSARMYAGARGSRFNVGLGSSGNSSADAELSSSLAQLRAASRQIVRDAPYAKRARAIVVNNIIGAGIGMQAQVKSTRGRLNRRINEDIERAWCEWCDPRHCHTGGTLHFADLERAAMGQVFDAGESFIRIHYAAMGGGAVPLSLELVEAERLADNLFQPGPTGPDNEVRLGVEVDVRFQRPVAYWIRRRHAGDIRAPGNAIDRYERVPADEIIHLRVVDRWPQTRGEPWLHAVVRKLDSIDQYTTSELRAAQNDATMFGSVKTTAVDGGPLANNQQEQKDEAARPEMQIEDGVIVDLEPGEELDYHTPTRPNTALDPFLRYMLREVSAGIPGVSYASLSNDYSQANYSSERVSQLDMRDTWRVFQQWWLRNFRHRLHRLWLQQAVLARAVPAVAREQYAPDPRKFEAVKFKPRGWNWVDPTKEVAAYKEAEKAGYISAEDVIAQTANGMDIEDVVDAMARSRDLYEEAGIVRDTDVAATNAATAGKVAQASAPAAGPPDPEEDSEGDSPDTNNQNDPPRRARVVQLGGR